MRNWLRLLVATAPLFPIAAIAVSCGGRASSVDPGDAADASLSTSQSAAAATARTPAQTGAPATLRMATLRAEQQAPGYDFAPSSADVLASHAGSHGATLDVRASAGSVKLTSARDLPAGAFELGLATTSVGRSDGSAGSRGVVGQRAEGQEVVVTRTDGVEERFLAGPLGLEQSYTLRARPAGTGSLLIQVAFDGLEPELAAGTTDRVGLRDAAGHVRTWYTDLTAVDATGRPLASHMTASGGGVTLVIDDNGATYPVRVDPLVWTVQSELTVTTGTQPGAAGDWFGASVAISGSIAIVGAPNHASGAGAAYVFALSGTTWSLQQALTAGDGLANDAFGTSVAVSGTTAVVGAPYHTGSKTESGAAYVFTQSGTTWTQQPTDLLGADAAGNDGFGTSVSISGSALIVGAPSHDVTGKGELGAAYLFAESGTTWGEQQELTASDGHIGDQFGFSVAVSGASAIVGAYQHDLTLGDGGTASAAGAAYVYGEASGTWSLQQQISASDAATADFFGYSVALSGQLAVVGAYQHDGATAQSAGAAYVFGGTSGVWTLQQELAASDGQQGDAFGFSVAVSGGTAVVGAYQHEVGTNTQQGAAYAFTQSGTTWTQQQELTATDGKASDLFGASVAASGDNTMVGAYQHLVGSNAQQGAAYVFLGAITGATGCYIGGTLYASGALEPGNECETCAPATSTTGWSAVTCTSPDACHTAGTCAAATGCSAPVLDTGFCYVAGVCIASGAVDPGNVCATCQPTVSTSKYSNVANGTTCNDGNKCDLGDTCQAGTCTAGSHVTCTAPDSCHTETCSATTGTCGAPVLDSGFCYIAGACVATGTVDPASVCETCQPTVSTSAYSDVTNGTTCNDGNKCDLGDTCQAGTCTAGSHVTCTAPDACHTAGTCSSTTGTCSAPTLDSGFCYIAGACVASGAVDPANACETCQPTASTSAYSNASNGTACNDGNKCDLGDTCQAGTCTAGSHVTCPAPDSCHTAGTCSSATGTCSAPTLDSGFCYIAGACVTSGTVDPANACQTCQPTASTSAYSNVSNGTACNDGNKCDLGDTCQAGTCTAGSHVTCTAPDSCHTAGTCSSSTGTCSAPTLKAGFCDIAGACVASGAAESGDLCETCQPGTSTTGYSSVANGTPCGTGEVCSAGVCTVVVTGGDAGGATDGGEVADAGEAKDAGTTSGDAGSSGDGGITVVDGGANKDAGGTTTDGGSAQDGGTTSNDGGGTTRDGGGASGDGGATEDGGSATEDGGSVVGEDSGVSTTEDAGASTGDDAGASTAEDGGTIVIGVPGEDGGLATSEDGGEDGGAGAGLVSQGNGCGCTTVGSPTHEESSLLMGVGVLGLVVVRRRRRGK